MKTNIYIFSNSILSRKSNSFTIDTIPETEPVHNIDIYEGENEQVLLPATKVEINGKSKHIPAESIEAFYTFGEVRFNTQFFKCASFYEIPVHMFNYYGNYIGSFIPVNNNGSGEVQILQYETYLNNYKRIYLAKSIIEAAVKNMLHILKSYSYSGSDLMEIISALNSIIEQIRFVDSINELLGIEGIARNHYYESWRLIFKHETDFEKRIKQPPFGVINSLISFGNSLLYAVCLNEIYRTKLNPYVGFIHEIGDKKQPLVYDISEIFKPVIADRVIFKVINMNMIKEKDFEITTKGYRLKEEARKKFVEEFENRLSTVIHHKRLNRKISYRSLIRMECYNLINYLKGNIKSYEPYRAS
ncbi:type I-B CRISPR-associated endonuclease Cas1b [Rosettibacter firmus]|uniref:type I-B CRISPR-associated endonuclease Cas1b n=1 Tax=Rosettibacter firmus TaxID=3111522 RepID=UPI00336BC68A